jgi:DNA-binding LacI/PurR family transcriptional regulator
MDEPVEEHAVDRHRMVTIADVAKRAGVSVPTVSKVVNGRNNVSARSRERVEQAIRALGYLRRKKLPGRNSILELVFHRLDGLWALDIVRGAQSVCAQRGFGVVVSESMDGHSVLATFGRRRLGECRTE